MADVSGLLLEILFNTSLSCGSRDLTAPGTFQPFVYASLNGSNQRQIICGIAAGESRCKKYAIIRKTKATQR